MMGENESRFFLSCDINSPVAYQVDRLEGFVKKSSSEIKCGLESSPPTLHVECALYIDGDLFGLPSRTRLEPTDKLKYQNDFRTLTAKYRDLSANAQLAFTVLDVSSSKQDVVVGGATLCLFNSKKRLKTGQHKLRLWLGKRADGSVPTSTPGKVPKQERGEIERLEKLENKYQRGQIPSIKWLDELTFKAIEKLRETERQCIGTCHLHLIVYLWPFEHPVHFQELGMNYLLPSPSFSTNELVCVWDPEVVRTNPCEKPSKSLARAVINRELKPNSHERKEISKILKYPPTRTLNDDERQLLWSFRYYLVSDKRALTKFLCCVEWSDIQEARQALELMREWAPIDTADVLQLLSPVFNSEVHAYAVNVLEQADDKELQFYLLPLVQALQFQHSDKSCLALFLVQRSANNVELASFLHWYIKVELLDPDLIHAKRYYATYETLKDYIKKYKREGREDDYGVQMWQSLVRQTELSDQLCKIVKEIKNVRGEKKIEKLRQLLSGIQSERACFDEPIQLPLEPKVLLTGIIPSESFIFNSSKNPLRLSFQTADGGKWKIIFKKGDDLRQDQLVVQIVSLMDQLLKRENFDLQLTPYRVLATGQDEGMVEFVPSSSLAQILSQHRSIITYLQQYQPDENGPFGITATCLETFIRSCAGYCVITYILGVGDRHLDNLLLRDDGRIFHIDFGFILGHDPKPFPPPMKLCKEMVEAMGGSESHYYGRFKTYCCEAYNILRKSSNSILNLFHLMARASIHNIASDPEKGILKIQEKFRLDLDDEESTQFFLSLINDSISALFPKVVETMHRWAQHRH